MLRKLRGQHAPLLVAGIGLLLWIGCAPEEETPMAEEPAPDEGMMDEMAEPLTAKATLQGRSDNQVTGSVVFTQEENGVKVVAEVQGAEPGLHGLHVHETGDCSAEDFTSTGGHFNPDGVDHGSPTSEVHHAGDLGNIEIGEDGSGTLELVADKLTVGEGPNSVVGRGVILHEKEDDFSQPTGAAGGRIGCGVVEEGTGM